MKSTAVVTGLLALFILLLLVTGAPMTQFFILGAVVLGLVAVLCSLVRARRIAARAGVGALSCTASAALWHTLSEFSKQTLTDPRTQQALDLFTTFVVLIVLVLIVLGIVGLIAKWQVASPKERKLPRPSVRRRAEILEPDRPYRALPAPQGGELENPRAKAGDELDLFGSGEDFRI